MTKIFIDKIQKYLVKLICYVIIGPRVKLNVLAKREVKKPNFLPGRKGGL